MSTTEAGRIYLDRSRQILGEIEETYRMLSSDSVSKSGRLRIVAPALFAMRKLGPVLGVYRKKYPNVVIDLSLADRAVDLIEDEFDLGILAARHITGQTAVSRHLTSTDYYACAAPGYVKRHGTPLHPSDLEKHLYLAFRSDQSANDIVFNASDGRQIKARPKPVLHADNVGMIRECALAGLGIATLSTYLVEDDISSGRLIRLLPEYNLPDCEFRVVYSNRKFLPIKVKTFVEVAIEYFRQSAGSA
jgi:DNA-binding transcriptional LysR family regulator